MQEVKLQITVLNNVCVSKLQFQQMIDNLIIRSEYAMAQRTKREE